MIGMFDSARSAPAEREPVLARQHEIEEDEIDPAVGQDLAHGAAVRRGADPEAFFGQRARDEIADLAMIVDDQDVRRARAWRKYRPSGAGCFRGMCVAIVAGCRA